MNRPLVQDWVWESTIGSSGGVKVDLWTDQPSPLTK